MACAAGMKNVFDYPEPMHHKVAMATTDAEEWAKKMKVESGSMKRTDLLSDPV